MEKGTKEVKFKLTEEEYEILLRESEVEHLKLSEYLRHKLFKIH